MTSKNPLDIEYLTHERVQRLIDVVRFCVEEISLTFDRWDETHVTGPGLYFAIVSGHSVRDYADVMGDDYWPVDISHEVLEDVDSFYDAASEVAMSRDGAVVISVDGVIQKQMVRFLDFTPDTVPQSEHAIEYEDWMGSRHMSAADTSARPEVVTTITLSEETGRLTLFEEGRYITTPYDEIRDERDTQGDSIE